MNTLLKKPIIFALRLVGLYPLYSLKIAGPIKDAGWFRSFYEERPVDADGNPIPWITYPAIDFISKRVRNDMCVFEYGSGGSTLWWAQRVRSVVSVEHEKTWYERVKKTLSDNVSLYQVDLDTNGMYAQKIREYDHAFDVVVLDGRDRVNCAKNSIDALKHDGIIIWDNTERKEYEDGYRFLGDHGFRRIQFTGLAPLINYTSETSIFYRTNNCFGI